MKQSVCKRCKDYFLPTQPKNILCVYCQGKPYKNNTIKLKSLKNKRNLELLRLASTGETVKEISLRFAITKRRVSQILAKYDVSICDPLHVLQEVYRKFSN